MAFAEWFRRKFLSDHIEPITGCATLRMQAAADAEEAEQERLEQERDDSERHADSGR